MILSRKLGRALIPILLIPLVLIFLLAAADRYMIALAEQREDLTGTMENVLREYQLRRTMAELNMRLIGSSYLMERFLESRDESLRYRVYFPSVTNMIQDYHRLHPDYREIRLIMPDGREEIRTTSVPVFNSVQSAAGETWFPDRMRTTTDIHSRREYLPDMDAHLLMMNLPLRDDLPLAERPYLTLALALDFLQDLTDSLRLGRQGHIFVSDEEGRIIHHPDPERIGRNHHDLDRRERSSRHIMLDTGLILHAVASPYEAIGSAMPVIILLLAGMFLIFFLVWSSLRIQMERLVLKPVSDLEAAADRYARGDFRPPEELRTDDELGALTRLFGHLGDSLKKAEAEMASLAYRDSLTGLANRNLFLMELEKELARSRRHGLKAGLLFLDLDGFKEINDTRGHDVGDLLLQSVAGRIGECLREEDHLAKMGRQSDGPEGRYPGLSRLGGDEFTVLLPDIHGEDDTIIVAERILNALSTPFELKGRSHAVSASIGIALYPDHGDTAVTLLKNADTAMYRVKEREKNAFQVYRPVFTATTERSYIVKSALNRALADEQLFLHYQPIIDLATGRLSGCEALLRWRHPELGMVSPGEFIPFAE